MLLPKKLAIDSRINLIHTSSPVEKRDLKTFEQMLKTLRSSFVNTKIFEVESRGLDPRYLAASENERLKKLKKAIKEVDWLAPIYGGTGCGDIVRYLKDDDLSLLRKNHPIVNGFSDATFLLNYLHFKLKLITFHYTNACGLFSHDNSKLFFDVLTGKVKNLSFYNKSYHWLSPNQGPEEKIEGIAIGGNLTTLRDLLDVCDIRPRSWENYILFIEDLGVDMEDLHRIIVALDERNIFMHIKALVIGRMDEKKLNSAWAKWNSVFGKKEEQLDHMFEYLISDVIEERIEDRDPLFMLKVDDLGHGVAKPMIVPIGAKTILHPDGRIEFVGPFVE